MTDDTKTAPTSREAQAAASRRHIADTALRLFAEGGFTRTSTRRIAKEAGVSEGLVFHHFPTKIELLRGALEGRTYLATEIAALAVRARDVPAKVVITAIGARFVSLMRSDQIEAQLFRMILGEAQSNPVVNEMLRTTREAVMNVLAGYLRARVEAGELRPDLPVETAVLTLMGAYISFFATHGHLDDADWDARATAYTREIADLWLKGAAAHG